MTTRTSGICAPPVNRKRVASGERLSTVNFSWNTLGPSVFAVTSTLVRASRTDFDTGSGTAGPIMSVRLIPLSILRSRYSLWQTNTKHPANRGDQVLRTHRSIRVGDSPEQFRIADILRGDHIQSFSLRNAVLL